MRVTYDRKANAAYVYLKDKIEANEAQKTYTCDPIEIDGDINLDFDKSGYLIGIEILNASQKLPLEFLKQAEIIG